MSVVYLLLVSPNLKKYLLTMLFNAPVTLNGRTMLDVQKSVNRGFRPMLA